MSLKQQEQELTQQPMRGGESVGKGRKGGWQFPEGARVRRAPPETPSGAFCTNRWRPQPRARLPRPRPPPPRTRPSSPPATGQRTSSTLQRPQSSSAYAYLSPVVVLRMLTAAAVLLSMPACLSNVRCISGVPRLVAFPSLHYDTRGGTLLLLSSMRNGVFGREGNMP